MLSQVILDTSELVGVKMFTLLLKKSCQNSADVWFFVHVKNVMYASVKKSGYLEKWVNARNSFINQ